MSKQHKIDLFDQDAVRKKIRTDPRFIAIRHYNFDIDKLEERYEECPEHIIAKALLITEEELAIETEKVVLKLRNLMGILV